MHTGAALEQHSLQKICQESEADVVIASARNPVTHKMEDSKLKEAAESSLHFESESPHNRAPSVAQSEMTQQRESQNFDDLNPRSS